MMPTGLMATMGVIWYKNDGESDGRLELTVLVMLRHRVGTIRLQAGNSEMMRRTWKNVVFDDPLRWISVLMEI